MSRSGCCHQCACHRVPQVQLTKAYTFCFAVPNTKPCSARAKMYPVLAERGWDQQDFDAHQIFHRLDALLPQARDPIIEGWQATLGPPPNLHGEPRDTLNRLIKQGVVSSEAAADEAFAPSIMSQHYPGIAEAALLKLEREAPGLASTKVPERFRAIMRNLDSLQRLGPMYTAREALNKMLPTHLTGIVPAADPDTGKGQCMTGMAHGMGQGKGWERGKGLGGSKGGGKSGGWGQGKEPGGGKATGKGKGKGPLPTPVGKGPPPTFLAKGKGKGWGPPPMSVSPHLPHPPFAPDGGAPPYPGNPPAMNGAIAH